jgi:uncharacterized phage-associated protein
MAYDAHEVANAILDIGDELHLGLTNMAVQKIAYFAHGWYLAENGQPLVKQEFEAWRNGPVLRGVWEALRASGSAPVAFRSRKLDPMTGELYEVKPNLTEADLAFVRRIVRMYGSRGAFELSEITHRPGSPWDAVWNAPAGQVTPGMIIRHDAVRAYFLRQDASAH